MLKKNRIENQLTQIKKEIQKEVVSIEEFDGDVTRKLREIERKAEAKSIAQRELHKAEISYKFDKPSITKSTYEQTKAESEKAFTSADEELESLISEVMENL